MSSSNMPTQMQDNNGVIIPLSTTDLILNVSKFGTANIIIVGYARHDSVGSDSEWRIYYNTFDTSGNVVRKRFADKTSNYAKIWTTDTSGKAITGASQATPCVITSNDHGLVTGDFIEIDSMAVGGMVELNSDGYGSRCFHVTRVNDDTFQLQVAISPTTDINSTGYAAYTSGGKFYKHEHLNYARS